MSGRAPYADTDGLIATGCDMEALSEHFDRVRARTDGSVDWQPKSEGRVVMWAIKRYRIGDSHGHTLARTEHTLGSYAAPPNMSERDEDGGYRWTRNEVERLAALADTDDESIVVPEPVAHRRGADFPALQRVPVRTPKDLAEVPAALGARPFCHVVEATATFVSVVCLDPGGDLSGWQGLDWRDRRTGQRLWLRTDDDEIGVAVRTLREVVEDWTQPAQGGEIEHLLVDPLSVRWVGPEGRAAELGNDAVQRGEDEVAVLAEAAWQLGPQRFAELTGLPERTAAYLARGRLIRRSTRERTVACLLERFGPDWHARLLDLAQERAAERIGRCGHPLKGRQRDWCSDACRKRAAREKRWIAAGALVCDTCGSRSHFSGTAEPGPVCPLCGAPWEVAS